MDPQTQGPAVRGRDERKGDGVIEQPVQKRTKKGKKRTPAAPSDIEYARVIPISKRTEGLLPEWEPVLLSKYEKAPSAVLSDDRLSVTSWKGYRMVRATHGAHEGTWYFEARMVHLGATGHCRLGWSTTKGEIQGPVGYDRHSFAYRDVQGSKVHKALREEYGQPFKEGDVIGCLLHMPLGGRPIQQQLKDVVKWKGGLYLRDEPEPEPEPLLGSFLGFSRNGEWQGVAYRNLLEGTYYPAVSLYTMPEQAEGATVKCNFGPCFKYPPPQLDECGSANPASQLAGEPPVQTTTTDAEAKGD